MTGRMEIVSGSMFIAQLEEVERLLSSGNAEHARLTLILLDNLAELVMVRAIRTECIRKASRRFLLEGRSGDWMEGTVASCIEQYSPRNFPGKVDRLVEWEKILQGDGALLKFGHELRNEVFHKDRAREGIVVPVTKAVLQIVVGLLEWLDPRWAYTGPLSLISDEATNQGRHPFVDYSRVRRIGDTMATKYRIADTELTQALSDYLVLRIDWVLDGLCFLCESDRAWEEDGGEAPSLYTDFVHWREIETDRCVADYTDMADASLVEFLGVKSLAGLLNRLARKRRKAMSIPCKEKPQALKDFEEICGLRYRKAEPWLDKIEKRVALAIDSYETAFLEMLSHHL